MSLNFIYGVAGSGKTQYIFDSIINKTNKKVCLVVPEQFTHEAEKMVLKHKGSIHKNSIDVLSFERIGVRIFSECGGLTAKRITNAGKGIIISKLLNKCDLSLYKNSKNTTGFSKLCANTLAEFKKYDITQEDLNKAYCKAENNILKAKINDFNKIYDMYSKELEKNYIDFEDVLDKLYNTIDNSSFFDDAIVVFDKFSSFIPKEINIIKKITKKAENVYMTLCTNTLVCNENTKSGVFSPVVITCDKLIKSCLKDNIKIGEKIHLTELKKHKNTKMLNVLAKALSENKFGIGKEINNEISLFFDKNPYYEVENTAKEILKLCRDDGYRYNQIGIICPNLTEYSGLIKSVFKKYNLPCFIDNKKELLSHQLVLFIIGAIDVYLEKYSYESIFSFLNFGLTDLTDSQVNILENYVLAVNLNKSAWYDDSKWNYTLKAYEKNEYLKEKSINETKKARDAFISKIKPFHDAIKGRKKASVMAKELYNYLENVGFFEKVSNMINVFEKNDDNESAKEYLSVTETIINTLDEIIIHIGDETINVEEFKNYLLSAFSMQSEGYVPYYSDIIIVGNVDRTVSGDIKALFVLGAIDGFFPTPKKADFIFTDLERDTLLENGLELSETSKTKAFYNKFLIYNCITTPSERLYVSFPVQDNASKALRPAFLFSTLKKIFTDIKIKMRENQDEGLENITTLNATSEHLISAIKDNDDNPIWSDVYKYYLENDMKKAEKIKDFFEYNPLANSISSSLMDKVFGNEIYTSVSKLQTYRSCKFMYFLKYILKIDEKEIFDLNAADIGTFVHMVFENLCRKIEEENNSFATVEDDYIKEKIDFYINQETEKLSQNSADDCKRQIFAIQRLKDAIFSCFDIVKFHIVNSSFIPVGYEIEFGKDDKTTFEIEADNGKKVKIMGVIDRADKYETEDGTFVRIIDYKTGKKTFNLSNIFYGLDVQLMVYLNALSNSDISFKKAGALYFKFEDYISKEKSRGQMSKAFSKMQTALKLKGLILDDEKVIGAYDEISSKRANKASSERFDTLSNHIKNGIKGLCNELFEGDFNIMPCNTKDLSPCTYCLYGSVCKFDEKNPLYKTENLKTLKDEEVWNKLEAENNVD